MATLKENNNNERERTLSVAHGDFEKGMNAYAFFKIHNRQTGQDLVQDTFMKTWRYLISGGKVELMKPFLYHILNHLIIDEYRKHKTSSLDSLLEKGYEPYFDDSERIGDTFDGQSALLLIQCLPTKYREVMRMRYVQELSLKEIALLTGQSRNTVAVQAHRGLIKLRKLYNRTK
jgi:RNA polymerase sigma-70 factor, ECF subfamily